jgi:alanine dehydrogenase
MRIGVPAEIKQNEYRVGLTPASVAELVHHGHAVTVEHNAAAAIDFPDDAYRAAGAAIAATAAEVFAAAELIVKVKEPQPVEVAMLRRGQLLFTYLHLAPVPGLARSLTDSGVTAIGYETVTDAAGGLPLLAPMSEVAGRMAIQAAAHALEIEQGGRGLLLCGVPGVASAHVVILGGGVVGSNAARMALGLEARVTVLEARLDRLHQIDALFGPRLDAVFSTRKAIDDYVREADVVIGAVLVPGATAPRLVTRSMVAGMRRGAVVGGGGGPPRARGGTTPPPTPANPTYVEEGVVHYCVANMPGAVAHTSTLSLNNATLPFVLALADRGLAGAMQHNPHLRAGLNVHDGAVTHPAVASAIGAAYVPAEKALGL